MGKIGYIDEYGNKSIKYQKKGVSTYFIVTAVIIDKSNIIEINDAVNNIRKKFTQAPELKSKNFNKYPSKRVSILKELTNLNIQIYSILVDKRNIWEDSGLKFHNSFYKYINRLIDSELYKYYPNIELVADEHGDEKFMTGFIEYVKSHHIQQDLFIKPTFRFANSINEPLIQVADFIAGSISKIFDPKKSYPNNDEIFKILQPKILHLREWPELPINIKSHIQDTDKQYDSYISKFALQLIKQYIDEYENSEDEIVIQQLITLKYLVFRFKSNPFEYIVTDQIISKIGQRDKNVPSIQIFRNQIIARLRDKDILIVSGPQGYKIPCSKSDLFLFFNMYSNIVCPMISRLEKANKLIKIATDGNIDLLTKKEYQVLSKMVNIINNQPY